MRTLLISTFAFLLVFQLQAQYKTGLVNTEYLMLQVMPDYQEKFGAFQQYLDSIYSATMNMPEVKQLQLDIENANNDDAASMVKANEASLKLNQLREILEIRGREDYSYKFPLILKLNNVIDRFKTDNGYDLLFMYGQTGITDIRYKDEKTSTAIGKMISDCISIPPGMSPEDAQIEANKQGPACQEKILSPMVETATDVTDQIEPLLIKN